MADYVRGLVEREYGRRLQPFFQGTIMAVTGAGPWQVQVQRSGEPTADGNTYLVPVFTKAASAEQSVPAVGQVWECMWRDDHVGYALWRLS